MGIAVVTGIYFSTTSWIVAGILYFIGMVGVSYIGYQPHIADMYQKAEQTATTAWVCYVIVGLGTLAYYLLSHPERSFTF